MSRKSKILSNAELSAFCQQISLIIAAGLQHLLGEKRCRKNTTVLQKEFCKERGHC